MIEGKIEKNVPYPARFKGGSPFTLEIIEFLDKLDVGDSVVFEVPAKSGYNFTVKVVTILKIYKVIKNQDFTTEDNIETHTFRVWRVK